MAGESAGTGEALFQLPKNLKVASDAQLLLPAPWLWRDNSTVPRS